MTSWRLILDPDLPGHENMARDSSILSSVESDASEATLRLYGWDAPTISIGYMQDIRPFLSSGLPIVRRMTGGRAVLHQMELTYSIAGLISDPVFEGGILGAYSSISRCIVAALKDAGVDAAFSRGAKSGRNAACFHTPSRYEVLAGGRKLVGSSQRRFKNAFLQHGSILYSIDKDLNERVFGEDITGRMASVSEFSPVSIARFRELLIERFSEGLKARFTVGGLTRKEEELKEGLKDRPSTEGAGRPAMPRDR